MSEGTYNGWANYPTWCVNLWLSNDGYIVSQPVDLLGSDSDLVYISEERRHRYAAMRRLQSYVHDLVDNDSASLASDLLGYAMSQVDWDELTDAWLEVVDERREYERQDS